MGAFNSRVLPMEFAGVPLVSVVSAIGATVAAVITLMVPSWAKVVIGALALFAFSAAVILFLTARELPMLPLWIQGIGEGALRGPGEEVE